MRDQAHSSRPPRHRALCWIALALPLTILVACSAQQAVDLPPQTLTDMPASAQETAERDAEAQRRAAAEAEAGESLPEIPEEEGEPAVAETKSVKKETVVISGDASGQARLSLFEASQRERQRRQASSPTGVVINDDNLAEMADGGSLTVVGTATGATSAERPAEPATGAATASNAPAASSEPATGRTAADQESHWRNRALEIRLGWRNALLDIQELELRVAELRRRFYAEDDPFYRDNEIKPAWDRALTELTVARQRADSYQFQLRDLQEEGRRAGAHPGWLREGVELEPTEEERGDPEDDPREPVVVDEERWAEP